MAQTRKPKLRSLQYIFNARSYKFPYVDQCHSKALKNGFVLIELLVIMNDVFYRVSGHICFSDRSK